jgi:hypothetical protein
MAKKIIWSLKAADNLEEICDFIGEDSEFYARIFAQRIRKTLTTSNPTLHELCSCLPTLFYCIPSIQILPV